ncbi:DUF2334 domain-containing protein [Acetoanaerobium pronyense]|uniref:DUF2334 domain-containing protein n=1 Tax=Acetoanaerobium pronyense TaxID=1482736 RepID=UPI001AEB76D7|nr:DUF2334 domain-containing protein [Acetoanaerobium pronyense]
MKNHINKRGRTYLYRVDDIHPCILWERLENLIELFKEYNVVPLLGIIPDNKDSSLKYETEKPLYWDIIKDMIEKGEIEICQHGYQHIYSTVQRSINQNLYGRVSPSEFANLPYEVQRDKIKRGMEILNSHGLYTDIWMAPSHTNDKNTFKALKSLGFKYITDGVAAYPFKKHGLTFIPQQIWEPKKEFVSGVFTICLHLDDLTEELIEDIREHLQSEDQIISFSQATKIKKRLHHKLFNIIYRLKRILYYHVIRRYRNIKKYRKKKYNNNKTDKAK